ncbi:unnamed protein product [Urochloa humidicola]
MTWKNHPAGAGAGANADHARLRELGYKQELKRHLSVVSNFSISFSIISVLTGVTTLYNTGLAFGGPATMTLGWFVAGAFTTPWPRFAPPSPPSAASTTGAPASPATVGRPSPPGSPAGTEISSCVLPCVLLCFDDWRSMRGENGVFQRLGQMYQQHCAVITEILAY